MELLKLLSASEIVAQIVNFLLLLFILRLFFWKRILKILDERKSRISLELKNIEDAKLQVAGLRSEYEKKLGEIDIEAAGKLKQATEEGKRIVAEMKKEAQLEGQKIIEGARNDIKYEISRAREELKEKIIDLSISAAENAIQEKLTEAGDRRLVKNFLDNIDQID